jgi:hypothetical protein
MTGKISISCLLLFIMLGGGAFAMGPLELTVYGGPTGSNYTGGYDLGASALIDLPVVPKIGVEFERSSLAGNVNITRLGLVYEQTLIPFLSSFKVSGGTSSISSDASFTIGSHTFSASAAANGSYVAAGLAFKVLFLSVNPKYVVNQYEGATVSEGIINAGMTF